jgi:TIR domain
MAKQIFLSHADEDAFEAGLLQAQLEQLLSDLGVRVWTYKRDQAGDERNIGGSIRDRVRESQAVIMLVSQYTIESGAAQWMELAYADAFSVPTFVLMHHITFEDLKRSGGVPPLVLQGQSTPAINWHTIEAELRRKLEVSP